MKLVGKEINYTYYRDGTMHEIQLIAENPPRWSPLVSKNKLQTSYIMFAGLVFSPYSRDSEGMENWDSWLSNVLKQKGRFFENKDDQIVIMTSILPHRVSIGYTFNDVRATGLLKVNDVEIRKISDVAVAIANATSEWITFLFANDIEIVIPLDDGFKATWEIKRDFRMTSIISKDIKGQIDPSLANKLLNNPQGSGNSIKSGSSSLFRGKAAKKPFSLDQDSLYNEADLGRMEVEIEDLLAQIETLMVSSGINLDLNISDGDLDYLDGVLYDGNLDGDGDMYDDDAYDVKF